MTTGGRRTLRLLPTTTGANGDSRHIIVQCIVRHSVA